jgi:hypothetical protein
MHIFLETGMRIRKAGLGLGVASALLVGFLMSTAHADVIFTATGNTIGGNSVSSSADFSISGDTLTVTLKNTSPANTTEVPGSTLTGVAFLLDNGDTIVLVPTSASSPNAIFNSAQCTINACPNTPQNVAGEWGYQDGFAAGAIATDHYAAGGVGFITTGLAGDIGNFNGGAAGTNLSGPPSGALNGIDFGIISASHGPLNPGDISNSPLIDDNVILTFTGVDGLTEDQITNVYFLYGTALTDITTIPGSCRGSDNCGDAFVPEPGSLALIGLALSGLAFARRRWQK